MNKESKSAIFLFMKATNQKKVKNLIFFGNSNWIELINLENLRMF